MGDAVIGTLVRAEAASRRGWRAVQFCDGREGFAKSRHIEPLPRSRRIVRERLAATAMRFMGIPYLWGGTTPKGFDCSGLIQRVFRLHGLVIPRDSDLQARYGRRKNAGETDELRTGDLLFFGKNEQQISHVAMYLSDSLFLHAYGQVRINALDPRHPLFDAKLAGDWRLPTDPLSD
jgi:cell wall-associated NlpC family hydrolase